MMLPDLLVEIHEERAAACTWGLLLATRQPAETTDLPGHPSPAERNAS